MTVGQVLHGHDCPHCGGCCALVNRLLGEAVEMVCMYCCAPYLKDQ